MSKQGRDNREGPPIRKPGGTLGWTELGTFVGLAVAIVVGIATWNETKMVSKTLSDRLGGLENRLNQIAAKVDSVAARPAAPPPQRGPDPNRVYQVLVDKAPFEGPKNAPITIAEFSDFQ